MRKEILQAILDDRQIMDKTDTGYTNVTNEFALRVMANGGGEFLAVKPIPKPNIRAFGKIFVLDKTVTFMHEPKGRANVSVVIDGNTFEVLAVYMRDTPEFNEK